jgi:hypothetical protein
MTPDAQPAGDRSANRGNSQDSDLVQEFTAATNSSAVPLSEWIAGDAEIGGESEPPEDLLDKLIGQ